MSETVDTSAAVMEYLGAGEAAPVKTAASQARFNLLSSVDVDSKFEAGLREAAQKAGVPVDTVRAFPQEIKKQNTLGAYDFEKMADEFPNTTKFYTNKENADIGHADVGVLKEAERVFGGALKWVMGAGGSGGSTVFGDAKAAYHAAQSGAAGGFSMVARTAAAPFNFLENFPSVGGNPLARLAEGFDIQANYHDQKSKEALGKSETWFGGAASQGVVSLVQNAPNMGLALLPGGQSAALSGMGFVSAGNTYQKDVVQGRDHVTALIHSLSDGTLEVATEMGPMRGLIDNIKAGTPLLSTMLKNFWQENKGEQVNTALQDLNDWAVNGSRKGESLVDYLKARPGAAAQTAIATLIGTGGNVALLHGVQTAADRVAGKNRQSEYQARAVEQQAQAFEALQKTLQASDMLTHSPATLSTYMQELADQGIPAVYVDSARLVEAGIDMPALAKVVPSIADQLDQIRIGGDFVIPTGELLVGPVGTEYAQALIDHARPDVNGMSRVAAKEYMENHGDAVMADIEKVMQAQDADAEFKAGRDALKDQILNELNALRRFTPAVNAQNALMLSSYYAVHAARAGMTVPQFAQRYGLGFARSAQKGGGSYDQAKAQGYEGSDIGEAAQWLAAKAKGLDMSVAARHRRAVDAGFLTTDKWQEVQNGVQHSGLESETQASQVGGGDSRLGAGGTGGLRAPGQLARFYHGTKDDINGFDLNHPNRKDTGWLGRGVYVTSNPDHADIYALQKRGAGSPQVMPLAVRLVNPFFAEEPFKRAMSRLSPHDVDLVSDMLKVAGYDGVLLQIDSETTEVAVFDPAAVRSENAAFDPSQSESANLLHQDASGVFDQAQDDADRTAKIGEFGHLFFQKARGSIAFGDDITQQKTIISLFDNADLSTFIHESGHFFLEVQADLSRRIQTGIAAGETLSEGERGIVDDFNKTLNWMGVKGTPELSPIEQWVLMPVDEKRPYHEMFARGFESYAFEGKAPSIELTSMFNTFRAWLISVYRQALAAVSTKKYNIEGVLNVKLSDEVRGVMDRMLATNDQIEAAEAARNMGALFQTAGEGGMDLEAYKMYHDMGVQASAAAQSELQSRGLGDMQWLGNARSRKLKELQKKHDALRAVIARDVRAQVMSQPVYRAWAFLTARGGDAVIGEKPAGKSTTINPEVDNLFEAIAKLGGLDAGQAKSQWGYESKNGTAESGVFGVPVVRKTGGYGIDAMAERLLEYGYLLPDEHGKADLDKFEELWDDQLRGVDRYSISRDMARAYGDAPAEIPAMPDVGKGKLRTEDLRYRYGTKDDAIWRVLSERKMTSDTTGLSPDIVAEMVGGFDSGDAMVRALAAAEPPKTVIEGMVDQRMLEEHGDLATPEGLERATDRALHNEARIRFVATELRALQHAMAVREKVPGRKGTVDVLVQAAKEYANTAIAQLKVRDVKPAKYAAAAARSAKLAVKATGDLAKQAEHKRNQLVNQYAAKAAYDAQDETEKAVAYLGKFENPSRKIDPAYAEKIVDMLARFDLHKGRTLKSIDKQKSLLSWVAELEEEGLVPDIPDHLLNEANKKSYKEMTVEEIRGLRDTVKQIEHLGRLKNRMLTSKSTRDFHIVVGEMVAGIDKHSKGRKANPRTPNTVLGSTLLAIKDFGAMHIKAATWARIMDGGKDGGAVWEYLIRTANVAGDQEVSMRETATKELSALLAPVLAEGKAGGKGEYFESVGRSLNKEARLAIALNMGNESNAQRLLGGEGWTRAQVQPVLDSLSAADVKFVQDVWDYFEKYRPLIAEKEKRVLGKEPEWLQAVPLTTKAGVLRGGYFPVKYDPRASERAEAHAQAEVQKQAMKGAYTSATTRRSFTKSRVDEVHGRPLMLSLDGLYSGVQEVIHDLSWHEFLIDANRLVKNKKIAESIRSTYGPEVHQQFKKWLEDVALGDRASLAAGEKALAYVRQGVSVSGLGWNVMSALVQPLGLTQSITRVGAKWVGKGVVRYVGSPFETVDEVHEKSEFMRTRGLTRLREIAEVKSQVKGQTKVRRAIDSSAYFLMLRAQQVADIPTWWGAYEKALSEGIGEDRAIALADQAVIDSQGGGSLKDQSAIERGGPALKLFTTFYSFFNVSLNLGAGAAMTADSKAKLAADYLLLYSVPVVLAAALKDALTPGDSGDWEDPEKIWKKLAGEHLGFLFNLMFGVRELSGAALALTGTNQYPTDYHGPVGLRLYSDVEKLTKQINQGELDSGLRKAIINVTGELARLPAAQVNRTLTGIEALNNGDTKNPLALIGGYQKPH